MGAVAVFSVLLLAGLWPAAPAQLPVSVGDILVLYRFLVLMLTILWVILNLLTDHVAGPKTPELMPLWATSQERCMTLPCSDVMKGKSPTKMQHISRGIASGRHL